jgi:hypothetical protein
MTKGLLVRGRAMRVAAVVFVAAVAVVALTAGGGGAATRALPPNVTQFASGLNNPRGLTFGPGGNLYVAEGGLGGSMTTTPADCAQVLPPVGPYSGGYTASIASVSPFGAVTRVVTGLPSSQTSPALGFMSGVADVDFIGNQLYALTAGAGCSHGLLGTNNSILRVNLSTGTTIPVANLSSFIKTHPVANPPSGDFEPDGTFYSMVPRNGILYVVEPNHGEIDWVNPVTHAIGRVVDVSAFFGHIVPTSLAMLGNALFFGDLGTFPIAPGSENVYLVTSTVTFKNITPVVSGLTTVLGVAFDSQGRMYVLESMTAPGFPGPSQFGTGTILRIDPTGPTTIATGLTFPTAMTFGPDGALYVSNLGFAGPGAGEILRVTVP